METLRCSRCKEYKALILFSRNKSRKTGYSAQCKECVRIGHKSWRERNPESYKEKNRVANKRLYASNPQIGLKKKAAKYGLTVDQYNDILSSNSGMCHICNEKPSECLDHCHETQNVRGALCQECNKGLGLFYDNVTYLQNAMSYLSGVSPLADNELKG